jgi:hypothetical protein
MQNHQLANGLIVSWHPAPLNGDFLRSTEDSRFAVVTQGTSILAMGDMAKRAGRGRVYLVGRNRRTKETRRTKQAK